MRFKTPVQALRAAAIALAFLIATPRLVAEDKKADDKASPEEAVLKSGEGTWDATVKSMGGESKATMTCKVGVGGKWAIEHFKGEFGGMPFEGRGATSYDPEKKKYINVWIDSMSANVMVSEGTYDKKTKTLTFVGKMPTPDGKSMKVTMISVDKDANTRVFTLKGTDADGKDMEMMQITYKRKAK